MRAATAGHGYARGPTEGVACLCERVVNKVDVATGIMSARHLSIRCSCSGVILLIVVRWVSIKHGGRGLGWGRAGSGRTWRHVSLLLFSQCGSIASSTEYEEAGLGTTSALKWLAPLPYASPCTTMDTKRETTSSSSTEQ